MTGVMGRGDCFPFLDYPIATGWAPLWLFTLVRWARGGRGRKVLSLGGWRGGNLWKMPHEHPGESPRRQDDVQDGPSERDDQALPAGFSEEASRIVRVFVAGLLTGHLHVTAE